MRKRHFAPRNNGLAVITLRSNVSALRAERSLRTATKEAATPLERLATGLRIQRAADDAAGLSIASVTGADARVRAVGIRNLNDGVDLLAIADAALVALSDIATRLGELAAQASNGALADPPITDFVCSMVRRTKRRYRRDTG